MPLFRTAVATSSLSPTLKRSIDIAARLGVAGLQIDARNELKPGDLSDTGRREFRHQLEEMGLEVASFRLPLRRSLADQDQLDARVAATKSVMEFAYQMGVGIVAVRVGKIPADSESPEYGLLRDVLDDLAAYGNRIGAVLALTPSGDSSESLRELFGRVTAGPIGLDFDPASFAMNDHSATDAFRDLHEFTLHLRVRDGIRDIDGGGLEVPVGRGDVDWLELLALLDEAQYSRWLTIDRTTGDDCAGDVARAVEFLANVTPHS